MRPLRKGAPYLYSDGERYARAKAGLAARVGPFCCYCERQLSHAQEVEHIQPKSLNPDLERVWANFLLVCKNCNATKRKQNKPLSDWLIPDRDNTALAFEYLEDGTIQACATLTPALKAKAETTLDLLDLNKSITPTLDERQKIVALDRRSQRFEAFLLAKRWLAFWTADQSTANKELICDLATKTGFFSVWMATFQSDPQIRECLIRKFPGTEVACFDPTTTDAVSPHPNHDGLPSGGKL